MSEWQPIATAPEMKTILLWAITDTATGNWKMATGFYHTGWDSQNGDSPWCWDGRHVKPWEALPTHWQHLPAPPVIK